MDCIGHRVVDLDTTERLSLSLIHQTTQCGPLVTFSPCGQNDGVRSKTVTLNQSEENKFKNTGNTDTKKTFLSLKKTKIFVALGVVISGVPY